MVASEPSAPTNIAALSRDKISIVEEALFALWRSKQTSILAHSQQGCADNAFRKTEIPQAELLRLADIMALHTKRG